MIDRSGILGVLKGEREMVLEVPVISCLERVPIKLKLRL